MNFLSLEEMYQKWQELLVIGKTIERESYNDYILGMTLADEAKLYILEAYRETELSKYRRRGVRNQRSILKEPQEICSRYLHCCSVQLGGESLHIQGGTASPMKYGLQDYGTIQLFLDLMTAEWKIPRWLKKEDWENLQLVTLDVAGVKKLPEYEPNMPVTLQYEPKRIPHFLEKTLTLTVGKSRSFHFLDHQGDEVQCYINDVSLVDVWEDVENQLRDPKYTQGISPAEVQQIKSHFYKVLEENCPRDMRYVCLEYECNKEIDLQFYSKQYLQSHPKKQKGCSGCIGVCSKPSHPFGAHHLPLKSCVLQTAVPPDTSKIPAELFLYFEEADVREETFC